MVRLDRRRRGCSLVAGVKVGDQRRGSTVWLSGGRYVEGVYYIDRTKQKESEMKAKGAGPLPLPGPTPKSNPIKYPTT